MDVCLSVCFCTLQVVTIVISANIVQYTSTLNWDWSVSGNNTFCVSSQTNPRHSYTLVANDELDKRHWLQKLNAALQSKCASHELHDTLAVSTRRQSKRVSKTESGCCEEVDASFSSIGSSSSLRSTFSFNSMSTLASVNRFVSTCGAGTVKDADADSGIVSWQATVDVLHSN